MHFATRSGPPPSTSDDDGELEAHIRTIDLSRRSGEIVQVADKGKMHETIASKESKDTGSAKEE